MEKELTSLDKLKIQDALFILGGTKLEEVIPLLKGRKILAGSYLGALCLLAQNKKVGKQEEVFKDQMSFMPQIQAITGNISVPVDYAIEKNKKRVNIMASELPTDFPILDIGDETIEKYIKEIKKSKAIFLKGPLGLIENKKFAKGTKEILTAMSKSKSFTVLAGGHTTTELAQLGINKTKFDYVSLSGGALLAYLSGKTLPGIAALESGKR
jgi:phosphoglycerate kinase